MKKLSYVAFSTYLILSPNEGVQDSLGFAIPRRGCRFRVLDSGFQTLVVCRISSVSFIADSKPKFAGVRIPQATITRIPEFEFPYNRGI